MESMFEMWSSNMSKRDNILKAIRFERPDYIPMTFHINAACWHHYDQTILQDLMEQHSFLFMNFKRQKEVIPHYDLLQRRNVPYTDPWGCVWKTTDDGITGSVYHHPLSDWNKFDDYCSPDPDETDGIYPINWGNIKDHIKRLKENAGLVFLGLPHGHTFLRLQFILGYENLICNMLNENSKFIKLIGMVEDFNYKYVTKLLMLKPDIIGYPEDLGMQVGPMLSPDCFRRFIKPVYNRIMKPARENGCIIHMHSDGDIHTLVDDLIEGGVDVINLQDLVNGVKWIADKFAHRTCVDLDIDRQLITPFGTPAQIDSLIREEVMSLGSRQGGLLMTYGLYPGVPLENVKALMDAMEKYALYYS